MVLCGLPARVSHIVSILERNMTKVLDYTMGAWYFGFVNMKRIEEIVSTLSAPTETINGDQKRKAGNMESSNRIVDTENGIATMNNQKQRDAIYTLPKLGELNHIDSLYYDYEIQAWIRDGVVEACGHPVGFGLSGRGCTACYCAGSTVAEAKQFLEDCRD